MTIDRTGTDGAEEYVRSLWQSHASEIEQVSIDDLHQRVEYLRKEFDRTRWVPWAGSAFLAVFFGVMLLAVASNAANVAGAIIGLIGAFVPAGYMVTFNRLQPPRAIIATMACVYAYRTQLERERGAMNASAITIAMMMIGAALLSVPSGAGPRQVLLSMAGPALTGVATAWYVRRQAKRHNQRIVELRRISA